MQAHTRDAPDDPVGNTGRKLALQFGILAVVTPATHQVEALALLGKQEGNISGIVLKIAIEAHDHLALRHVETRGHRCRLAVVLAQEHAHQLRHVRADPFQNSSRCIGRPIVDQHQFKVFTGRTQCAEELLNQFRQTLLLVVERHHDREVKPCHGDQARIAAT